MKNRCEEFQHYFSPSQEVQILQLQRSKSPMSYERKLPHLSLGDSDIEDEPSVEFSFPCSLDRRRRRYEPCDGLGRPASLGKIVSGKLNCMPGSMVLQPCDGGKYSCVSSDNSMIQSDQAFLLHCESSGHPPSEDHVFFPNDSVDSVEGEIASDRCEGHSISGNSDDNFSNSPGCDLTSDDDDGSVGSKIFGRSSTDKPMLGSIAKGGSNEQFYQKSLKSRGVKLQYCTEELGSESSDVQEEGIPGEYFIGRDLKKNAGWQDSTEKTALEEMVSGYRVVEAEGDAENGYIEERTCAPVKLEPIADTLHTPKHTGKFPPPLSPITMMGRLDCPSNSGLVYLRPYRKDGRFVLREVRIPCRDYLRSTRQGGRLKLELVRHSEGIDHDCENSDLLEKSNFENRVPEEFHLQEVVATEIERERRYGSVVEEYYSPNLKVESNVFDRKGNASNGIVIGSQSAKETRYQGNESETREREARKECSSQVEKFCSTMGKYFKTSNFNLSEESCAYQDENLQVSSVREELSCFRMYLDDVSRRFPQNQLLHSADPEGGPESGCLNAIASDLSKLLVSFGLEADNGKCLEGQLKENFTGDHWTHFEGARSLPATICHDLQASLAQMRAAICKFELVQNLSCRERLDRAERKNCSTYWELHCIATSS